jgi:hypothetical protein
MVQQNVSDQIIEAELHPVWIQLQGTTGKEHKIECY